MRARRSKAWLGLIRVIGVLVPRRLRADWRQEWEVAGLLLACSNGLQ